MIENVTKLKKFYLICGYDSIAKEVVKEYKFKNKNIIVIDNDAKKVEEAKKMVCNPSYLTLVAKRAMKNCI